MKKCKTSITIHAIALFLCVFISNTQLTNAQRILFGDLKFLKGVKSINVVFDYSGFKIEDELEVDYVNREVAEKNEKVPGSGDEFKANWENDKLYWIKAFKKSMKDNDINLILDDPKARYTLIVCNINLTSKGWGNRFTIGGSAGMIVEFNFVETKDQTNSLCLLCEESARFMSVSGTLSHNIQGCFEYCGYRLGKTIKKKL